jgi:hypothetical protein
MPGGGARTAGVTCATCDAGHMTESRNLGAFAHTLQTIYNDTRLSVPEGIGFAEVRLVHGLAEHGIALTPDVIRALAFATVEGREL